MAAEAWRPVLPPERTSGPAQSAQRLSVRRMPPRCGGGGIAGCRKRTYAWRRER